LSINRLPVVWLAELLALRSRPTREDDVPETPVVSLTEQLRDRVCVSPGMRDTGLPESEIVEPIATIFSQCRINRTPTSNLVPMFVVW